MGPLVGLLVVVVVASVAYLFAHVAAQARGRRWRVAAHAAGLTDVVTSDFLGIETGLTGRAGLLRVSLERYQRGKHERGTRVVVDGLGHPSYEFALRKEGVGSAIEKAFGEREIELGDDEFDRRAYIHGSPRVVHAVLDFETRQLVGELIDGRIPIGNSDPLKARVAVSDGALRAEIPERAFEPGGERLPEAVETLLRAARRLALPEDVPARLAQNARTEPLPAVRLANLLTLVREYPTYLATREALRAGCEDRDDEVRLRAALALGEEGHDVLRRIASGVSIADGRSARAVAALGEHLALEEAEGVLRHALEEGRRETARAAVRALGLIGGAEVVASLAGALEAEDDELVRDAATALGATGDPGAEDPLVAALDRDGPTVWPAIAESLGRVGGAGAVAPLRAMAARFPFDLGLRRASRQAIAAIQSRLTGATPGQLSLADGGAGQLSLAGESADGRVSIADEVPAAAAGESSGGEGHEHWPTGGEPPAVFDPSGGEGDVRPSPAPSRSKAE